MSYKSSAYAIRTEESGGVIRYFVSFKDGQAVFHEIEVSHEMYLEFRGFIRKEHNLRQSEWQHNEFSDLTDETLNRRARFMPKRVLKQSHLSEHYDLDDKIIKYYPQEIKAYEERMRIQPL